MNQSRQSNLVHIIFRLKRTRYRVAFSRYSKMKMEWVFRMIPVNFFTIEAVSCSHDDDITKQEIFTYRFSITHWKEFAVVTPNRNKCSEELDRMGRNLVSLVLKKGRKEFEKYPSWIKCQNVMKIFPCDKSVTKSMTWKTERDFRLETSWANQRTRIRWQGAITRGCSPRAFQVERLVLR